MSQTNLSHCKKRPLDRLNTYIWIIDVLTKRYIFANADRVLIRLAEL